MRPQWPQGSQRSICYTVTFSSPGMMLRLRWVSIKEQNPSQSSAWCIVAFDHHFQTPSNPSQCWIVWKDEGNGIYWLWCWSWSRYWSWSFKEPHSVPQQCFLTFLATQGKPLCLDFKLLMVVSDTTLCPKFIVMLKKLNFPIIWFLKLQNLESLELIVQKMLAGKEWVVSMLVPQCMSLLAKTLQYLHFSSYIIVLGITRSSS